MLSEIGWNVLKYIGGASIIDGILLLIWILAVKSKERRIRADSEADKALKDAVRREKEENAQEDEINEFFKKVEAARDGIH